MTLIKNNTFKTKHTHLSDAKRHQLFLQYEMLSVKTLYHLIDAGFLGIKNIDLNKIGLTPTKETVWTLLWRPL